MAQEVKSIFSNETDRKGFWICPECETENEPDAKVCEACGWQRSMNAAVETENRRDLEADVSQPAPQQIEADGSGFETEKQVNWALILSTAALYGCFYIIEGIFYRGDMPPYGIIGLGTVINGLIFALWAHIHLTQNTTCKCILLSLTALCEALFYCYERKNWLILTGFMTRKCVALGIVFGAIWMTAFLAKRKHGTSKKSFKIVAVITISLAVFFTVGDLGFLSFFANFPF